jgi:hypothetical protein
MRAAFPSHRHIRVVGVAAAALLSSAAAARAQFPAATGSTFADSVCTIHELSRHPLVVQDSLEMYVPAQGPVASSTEEIFLAGFPNYLFARQPSGPARLVAESGVLGVVLDSAGNGRAVPAPMDPRRIEDARAVARAGGGWEVVFTELAVPVEPGTRRSATDSIAGLWSGTYDGREWTSLHRLEHPADVRLIPAPRISAPVVHGDRLAWAVSGFGPQGPVLLVLERVGGTWTTTTLRTGVRTYPSLAYLPTGELALAAVGGDGSRPVEVNSLFLWAPVSAETPPRRFADERPAHFPTLVPWRGHLVLTWTAEAAGREEVWAATDALSPRPAAPTLVDPSSRPMHTPAAVTLADGSFAWVTARAASAALPPEIQLRVRGSDGRWQAGTLPSPFPIGLGAASTRGGNIMLVGVDDDGAASMVRTLVVTVQMRCGSAPPS